MAARPEPLARIDRYFAAARIAHEAIWDLHHELVVSGSADERTRELLSEAARIAAVDMSDVSTEVRRLDALWSEQELLHPAAAANTLSALAAEVDRVEPQLAQLRARQDEIARELLRRVNETDD
jgi:hypothetical protein